MTTEVETKEVEQPLVDAASNVDTDVDMDAPKERWYSTRMLRAVVISALVIAIISFLAVFILYALVGMGWNKETNTNNTPKYYWNYRGVGLSSIIKGSSDPSAYGTIQYLDPTNPLTFEQAQAWVVQNGGVSINYPTKPCATTPNPEPCYFIWSTQPFVTVADGNPDWMSSSLVATATRT